MLEAFLKIYNDLYWSVSYDTNYRMERIRKDEFYDAIY